MKSSMPIKPASKRVQAQKKGQKKTGKNKTGMVLIIICVIVVAAALYFLLGNRSPKTGVADGPKNDSAETGDTLQARGPQEPLISLAKAKLKLESVNNKDIVRVVVEKSTGSDGSEVLYKYEWSINGQPAGDGSDSLSGFKRGDKVAVKVTPFEGEKAGQPRVLEFAVQNALPQITDDKQMKYDGKSFSYQIKGVDPDGDPLTYVLAEAPQGMTIDPQTGVINWRLKENDYGQHTIKVKIADNKGGVIMHTVKIDLTKPAEEKKTTENQK